MSTDSSYRSEGVWGPPEPALAAGAYVAAGYEVIAHLRRGNRLDVYDVWSEERGCRCVAKVLRPERSGDEKAIERIHLEGKLLTTLTHPHLLRAYEMVETLAHPRPALILETLPGHTVDYLIEEHQRLPGPDVAILGMQLCSVLGYLHANGWLHLDVKPSNIVESGGRAILLDLSVAERIGAVDVGGTFDYLAPEQARGDAVHESADVWGLGVTLWECLVGQAPFEDWDEKQRTPEGERLYPQVERRAPRLSELRRIRTDLAKVVDRCLEPDPADRADLLEISTLLAAIAGIDPRTEGADDPY